MKVEFYDRYLWPTKAGTKLMLDALTATSICPGPGGTRSQATSSIDSKITGCADLQTAAVALMVRHGAFPLFGGAAEWGTTAPYTTRRFARRRWAHDALRPLVRPEDMTPRIAQVTAYGTR